MSKSAKILFKNPQFKPSLFFLTTITKTLISPSKVGIKSSFWTFFDSKFPDLEAGIDIDWCLTFSTEINSFKVEKNVKI